jgi:hypothetical protein
MSSRRVYLTPDPGSKLHLVGKDQVIAILDEINTPEIVFDTAG